MVKKTTTKVSTAKTKKPLQKSAARPSAKKASKVDYYPNRMTVAVSAAAAVSLTLLAIIAVHTSA